MDRLWKVTTICASIIGLLSISYMFYFSATKSVVITEEHDRTGDGNLSSLIELCLEEKEKYEFFVLVNAAHGGENQGNAVNEFQEKEVTLKVAGLLEELSEEGKIGIFNIRREDMNISNVSRGEFIEQIEPDLLIDLHVNADPENERTTGTAVYYNGNYYRHDLVNVQFADLMERALVTAIQGKALGIIEDTEGKYPLLSMVKVPAVSIEMGYMTNRDEARLLKKQSYQELLAKGIYEGVLDAMEEIKKNE